MNTYTLVQYGNLNLTHPTLLTDSAPADRGNIHSIQRLNNARAAGSTPVNRVVSEKNITLTGSARASDNETLSEVINRANLALDQESRYLRFLRRWDRLVIPSDTQSWVGAGDTISYAYTTNNVWFNEAIEFVSDVSATADNYSVIYTSDGAGAELENYDQQGNFEVYLYIPNAKYITSIEYSVGSDSSNYVSSSAQTTQYDDYAIVDGWNCFSQRWSEMAQTGTPDPNTMGRYTYIKVNYSASQEDSTFVFGGVIWQDDYITRNYRALQTSLIPEENHYNVTRSNFQIEILCYEGIAESTSQDTLLTTTAATNPYSFDVTLEGTYEPEPLITLRLNNVTNLDTITLQNETTGDSVTVDETWAVDDIIEIDIDQRQVRRNNTQIDYTSVLPRFKVGRNSLVVTQTSTSQNTQSQTTNNTNLIGEV